MKNTDKKFKSLVGMLEVFATEQDCINYLTKTRWNNDVCCPFCGVLNPYKFKNQNTYKCSDRDCRKKFNAKTGTIFENTKVSMKKWFIAIYLHSSHKKGITSIQLSKDIEVTQTTAWFMLHRIRKMMKEDTSIPFSGTVEVDETFIGGKNKNRHKDKKFNYKKIRDRTFPDKVPVMGLLERETKTIRAFVLPSVHKTHTDKVIFTNVYANSKLYTDEWKSYKFMGRYYYHTQVEHSRGQYTNGEASTNGIEGAWSHLKRTIFGVYHSVSPKHLQAYCDEFCFRYNTKTLDEGERFSRVISQCEGRLKHKQLVKN